MAQKFEKINNNSHNKSKYMLFKTNFQLVKSIMQKYLLYKSGLARKSYSNIKQKNEWIDFIKQIDLLINMIKPNHQSILTEVFIKNKPWTSIYVSYGTYYLHLKGLFSEIIPMLANETLNLCLIEGNIYGNKLFH